MIGVRQRELGIKDIGRSVTVPDHPMAKLMYYLQSVDVLTDFGIPDHITSYNYYYNLSFDEENAVLGLAILLSPDLFVEKGIMINEPRLCFDSLNKFYEISDTRSAIAATQEFIIAGKTVHTLKIMAFEMPWVQNYYIDPIKAYSRRISAIANGTVENLRPRAITYNRETNNNNNRPSNTNNNYNKPSNNNYNHQQTRNTNNNSNSNQNQSKNSNDEEHHRHRHKHRHRHHSKKKKCTIF